ncbi:MAG: PHP domain-containing protein [Chloroflexi bacterium]|nr:PHP domain-containing protein [Chloroflexota bacterium]
MIIDLHVHTSRGSGDSSLSPQQLVDMARRIGLDGACLTEHGGPWDRFEFQRFASQQDGLLLIPALEIETDAGHITVFGLDGYAPGIRDPQELRRIADEVGAYMVLAHPFRYLLQRPGYNDNLLFKDRISYPGTPEEALNHPIFQLVDAIEVANGATADEENAFAWEVARRLGKPMVGGSDSHSIHGLGRCATVFTELITSHEEFLNALRSGSFYPTTGLYAGNLEPFRSSQA